MVHTQPVNIEMLNDNNLMQQLDWKQLQDLVLLATNAVQIDKIVQSKNMNYQVLITILANKKSTLEYLDHKSLLILIKNSENIDEINCIFGGINARRFKQLAASITK